jgi:hypothetical protein
VQECTAALVRVPVYLKPVTRCVHDLQHHLRTSSRVVAGMREQQNPGCWCIGRGYGCRVASPQFPGLFQLVLGFARLCGSKTSVTQMERNLLGADYV